jgi:hypothetical protein
MTRAISSFLAFSSITYSDFIHLHYDWIYIAYLRMIQTKEHFLACVMHLCRNSLGRGAEHQEHCQSISYSEWYLSNTSDSPYRLRDTIQDTWYALGLSSIHNLKFEKHWILLYQPSCRDCKVQRVLTTVCDSYDHWVFRDFVHCLALLTECTVSKFGLVSSSGGNKGRHVPRCSR